MSTCPTTLVYDHGTVTALAAHLAKLLAPATSDPLDELSEEALAELLAAKLDGLEGPRRSTGS